MPLPKSTIVYVFLTFCVYAAKVPANAETPAPAVAPSAARPAQSVHLTLKKAIDLALERNPDLHIANERLAAAEAETGASLAAFYPQIKARIGYLYTDNPAVAFGKIVAQRRFSFDQNINNPGGVTDFRPELEATWSLYRGGQDYQRRLVADLSLEISELERSTVRNNLIHGVTESFYSLKIAEENQKIARRSIDLVNAELQDAQTRYRAGTRLKSDILSIESRLAVVQETEIRAQNAIEMALTVLRTLLDSPEESAMEADIDPSSPLPEMPGKVSHLESQALAERPEARITRKQVETRKHELMIAEGEHLPRVDAYVSYGINEPSPQFSFKRDNVTSGIAVEMDLFSGFATSAHIRKAERRLAEANAQLRKTDLQIRREVKSASLELQDALARARVAQTAVVAAEEALRLVTLQHRAGTATVTRYLESEIAREETQTQWQTARYDAFRADAALQRALGAWR